MRRVYVCGIGATPIGEHWELSLRDLMVLAAKKALEDSTLTKRDIEAVYIGNMSSGILQGQEHLGSLFSYLFTTQNDGSCRIL